MTPVHRKILALIACWPLLVLGTLVLKHWQWAPWLALIHELMHR